MNAFAMLMYCLSKIFKKVKRLTINENHKQSEHTITSHFLNFYFTLVNFNFTKVNNNKNKFILFLLLITAK